MAIADLIDNYNNGATGTFVDNSGDTIEYSISSDGNATTNWNTVDSGAKFYSQTASTSVASAGDPVTITFDQTVAPGLGITMDGMQNSDEQLSVMINGVTVDLQTMIDDGDAYLLDNGGVFDGNLGTTSGVNAAATVIFTIPIDSITLTGADAGGAVAWFAADLVMDDTVVPCFASGTQIATPSGLTPIEDLTVGAEVITADNAVQRIRWIGSQKMTAKQFAHNPKLLPITIKSGALGDGLPHCDLTVSRQHRILIGTKIAEKMFGTPDVLVPAVKLLALDGVDVAYNIEHVEYHHLLFDNHEIIFAEGMPSESLLLAQMSLRGLAKPARDEILMIFPDIYKTPNLMKRARVFPNKGKRVEQFITRLKQKIVREKTQTGALI